MPNTVLLNDYHSLLAQFGLAGGNIIAAGKIINYFSSCLIFCMRTSTDIEVQFPDPLGIST